MAEFIQLTISTKDGPSSKDTLVNVGHIGSIYTGEDIGNGPVSWLTLRGGKLKDKPLAVCGSVDDIRAAICTDAKVGVLSHNAKGV